MQFKDKTKKLYYICPNCETDKIKVDFEELSKVVIRAIKSCIKIVSDFEKALSECSKNPHEREIREKTNSIVKLKNKKIKLFEKYADDDLSESEYVAKDMEYSAKIDILEKSVFHLESDVKPQNEPLKNLLKYTRFRKLTSEILSAFILKIVVSNDNKLHIIFKFEDCLEKTQNYIKRRKNS